MYDLPSAVNSRTSPLNEILIISLFLIYHSIQITTNITPGIPPIVQYPCKVKKNRELDNTIACFFRVISIKSQMTDFY
jgi:hypothetical protein